MEDEVDGECDVGDDEGGTGESEEGRLEIDIGIEVE